VAARCGPDLNAATCKASALREPAEDPMASMVPSELGVADDRIAEPAGPGDKRSDAGTVRPAAGRLIFRGGDASQDVPRSLPVVNPGPSGRQPAALELHAKRGSTREIADTTSGDCGVPGTHVTIAAWVKRGVAGV
jgi:hypothetical protein